MKVFKEIPPLKKDITKARKSGKRIGFVPTMGNLHEGHLSLLKKCRKENDISVLSIYVNPTQFGPAEDFGRYPRTLKRDLKLARKVGCDIVFTPTDIIMYPYDFSTFVDEEKLSLPLCGARRPCHFKGVTTIVAKLFNIVEPHVAYFGQKDAQQALVIKRMTRDLNFNIEIKVLPTVREKNRLAMSSRNNYLTPTEREKAGIIYKSLQNGKRTFDSGERESSKIIESVKEMLKKEPIIKIDYIGLKSCNDLSLAERIKEDSLLAISASIRDIHLIDNIILK